jgi:hypothetical protein
MTTITLNHRELTFLPDCTKPPKGYRKLTTTTAITKPIAKSIVEAKYGEFYVDYTDPSNFFGCAFASFESLLEKHSLTGRYAIIEKI